jgi:drug/metabolite transporter (DMT)-like permease
MGVFSRNTGFSAEVITFFRLFGGSLFLLVFLGVKGNLRHVCSWPGWSVIINGCFLSGFIISYVSAMNYTTMANAIMVLYFAPLIASVFAHLFLKERLNITSVLLICGALFGFAMMLEFNFSFTGDSNYLIGMGYALIGLCCYTGFIIVNRMIRPGIHIYTRTYYQLMVGALCVVPFLLSDFPQLSLHNTLWATGAALIPGFLGTLCAVIALHQLPTATYGTLAYTEPIFVIILGWFIFDERLGALQLVGCAIILCCGVIKGYLSVGDDK